MRSVYFIALGAALLGGSVETTAQVISNVRMPVASTVGAIIRWDTDAISDGLVMYGTTPNCEKSKKEVKSTSDHYVFLDNLEAGTTYHYKVVSNKNSSNVQTFQTAASIKDLWPVVSISFDDNHHSHYDTAYPMMRARNMRGADNIITNRLSWTRGFTTLEQLHELENNGWEIASHSHSHNRDKTITWEQEIVGSKDALEKAGFKPVKSLRLAGGGTDETHMTLCTATYDLIWGRTVGRPYSEHPAFTSLPIQKGIYSGTPLDETGSKSREERVKKYTDAVERMLQKHLYTHFIFHKIEVSPKPSWNYPPDEFEAFLDYLESKNIKVIPPRELME